MRKAAKDFDFRFFFNFCPESVPLRIEISDQSSEGPKPSGLKPNGRSSKVCGVLQIRGALRAAITLSLADRPSLSLTLPVRESPIQGPPNRRGSAPRRNPADAARGRLVNAPNSNLQSTM